MSERIVHICARGAWLEAVQAGSYRAASLAQEGFIHASRPEQVLEVANRFYQDTPDLVLLWIEPQRLAAPLRFEPADGDLYPHIFGPLNLEAVVASSAFAPDPDGIFRRLPDF